MLSRTLQLLVFIFCLSGITNAQTYYQVTDTTGTQSVGSNNVTIVPFGYHTTYYPCGSQYWYSSHYGATFLPFPGGFKYVFSNPVGQVRIHVNNINIDDTMAVFINGSHYNITFSNLSSYLFSCNSQVYNVIPTSGGNLTDTVVGGGYVQIDIQPGYSIDSISVNAISTLGWGFAWDFYFASSCPGLITAYASHDTVCIGDTLHLFASGVNLTSSVTYSWIGPNGFSSSLQNPVINNISAAAAGTYTVSVTDSSGVCNYSSTSTVNITVNTPFSLTASSNSPLCPGDTLHLNVNTVSGASYHWTGPNSFSSYTQNPSIHPFIVTDTGTYIVHTTAFACQASSSVHVSAKNSPPAPALSYNYPLCAGDTLKLSATGLGTSSYYWTGPNSFFSSLANSFIANADSSDAGNYTVTVSDTGNCTNFSTISVIIKPRPANLSIVTNSPVCYGSALNFSANSTSSNVIYTWTGPNNLNSYSQNVSVAFTNFSDSGDYYLTTTLNGCSTFDTVHAVIAVKPAMPSASCNTLFCAGDTLFLLANDITSGVTYYWTGPNNFADTVQNPIIPNTQNADSGNYIVRAVFNGCSSDPDSVAAIIYPIPSDTVLSNGRAIICFNIGSVMLSAVVVQGQTYQWYENGIIILGATSFQHLATSAGTYNVHIYNLQGCSIFTNSISVTVATSPIPVITAVGNVLSTGVYTSYQWTLNGNSISGATNQTYTATQNGSYSVIVTDSNGCSGTTIEPYPINDLDVSGTSFKNDELTIYPNPVVSVLYIEAREKIIVSLSSIDGKMQIQKNGAEIIDMTGMSNGVYLLKVFNDKGALLKVEKIVKE